MKTRNNRLENVQDDAPNDLRNDLGLSDALEEEANDITERDDDDCLAKNN
jgi:hypothetical protein